jgi:hypothetical protein
VSESPARLPVRIRLTAVEVDFLDRLLDAYLGSETAWRPGERESFEAIRRKMAKQG